MKKLFPTEKEFTDMEFFKSKCSPNEVINIKTNDYIDVIGYFNSDWNWIYHNLKGPAQIRKIGDKIYEVKYVIHGELLSKEDYDKKIWFIEVNNSIINNI